MHIVELSRSGQGLAGPMAQMRTWLAHHRIDPILFEFALLPNREIRFRVQFREPAEAAAFAEAFGASGRPDQHQEQRTLAA
jgi:hypothetical protein